MPSAKEEKTKTRKNMLFAAICTGVPGMVATVSIWRYSHSYFMPWVVLSVLILFLLFVVTFLIENKATLIIRKIVLTLCITYLSLEILTYTLICFGVIRPDIGFFYKGIMASDKAFAQFDSIAGFRGIPGTFRYLSIEQGKLEIDHQIMVNKQGWFSKYDYNSKKKSSSVKRYVVLGDSYSAALATGIPWPDRFQDLCEQNGVDSIELYNFSLDGSGLVNWHRIFFKHIIPNYDFDGVIIASSSEKSAHPDLDRHFFVMHSFEQNTAIQMINALKEPIPSKFPTEKGVPIISIYPSKELNFIKDNYTNSTSKFHFTLKTPDLWFLFAFYGISDGIKNMIHLTNNASAYNKPFENYYSKKELPYKMEYFDERYKYASLLKEILDYCQLHQKKTILVSIPDVENAKEFSKGNKVMCINELEFLSKHYNLSFINGFSIFKGKSEGFIDSSFYMYDRHWTPEGSAIFSDYLYKNRKVLE